MVGEGANGRRNLANIAAAIVGCSALLPVN